MNIFSLKSRVLENEEDLTLFTFDVFESNNYALQEGEIVVFASKIVAICEGMLTTSPLEEVLQQDAEVCITEGPYHLTVSQGIFIANAGADHSNVPEGMLVRWPKDPYSSASMIREKLMDHYGLTRLGVIITDSVCTPLRAGTTGLALAYAGFEGIDDNRGKKDLFGKDLEVSRTNIADSLASAANLTMGEAAESSPLAIIQEAPVTFTDDPIDPKSLRIAPQECLFSDLYPESLLESPL